jgi:hypothetical protein
LTSGDRRAPVVRHDRPSVAAAAASNPDGSIRAVDAMTYTYCQGVYLGACIWGRVSSWPSATGTRGGLTWPVGAENLVTTSEQQFAACDTATTAYGRDRHDRSSWPFDSVT